LIQLFLIFFLQQLSICEESGDGNILKTQVVFKQGTIIFMIDPEVNIKKLTGRISLRKISFNINMTKDDLPSSLNESYKNLVWKFYAIYLRVQNLLNMHSAIQNSLTIRIFHDYNKIRAALSNALHSDAPAYYNHRLKTLFISENKIDEYILAHELAHVIISNYFLIEPPVKTQEILAIYCDSHLKDDSV
jgi:hypothetical protein